MPNTFLTPKIIAQEALMVLENQLTMANLVHRDYSKEFVKVGDSIEYIFYCICMIKVYSKT